MLRGLLALSAFALALPANAAVVTYTLSLNEGINGQCQANRFVVYASDSQGDNFGMRTFAVKILPASGGPTLSSFFNRSPSGHFDADPTDPDFDPNVAYPTKYAGFTETRVETSGNGIVSGIQRLNDVDSIRIGGFGQTSGNMNNFHPPAAGVSYGAYQADSLTDVAYGTSGGLLPAGSLRLATGVWSGPIAPSFDLTSDVNRALVYTDSGLNTYIGANLLYQTYAYCVVVPEPSLLLAASLGLLGRQRRRAGIIRLERANRDDVEGRVDTDCGGRSARVLRGGGVCSQ